MNDLDLVMAAEKLIKTFPDVGLMTLGDMLGTLDQWQSSRTHYHSIVNTVCVEEEHGR